MVEFASGHPVGDKAALADWMGYETVEQMDADHDPLHRLLAERLDAPSYSAKVAAGERMTPQEDDLARMEEAAVLHVQRWLRHLKNYGQAD
jgi:hypothetical protein